MLKSRFCLLLVPFILMPVHSIAAQPLTAEQVAPPSLLFELLALNKDLSTPKSPRYFSPSDLVISPDGTLLFVAEQTAKQVAVVDLATRLVRNTIHLPNEVTGLALSPDGATLYAICSSDYWPNGTVCIVDVASGRVADRIGVGSGARAPVLSPDGGRLFVCNRYDNNVSIIDVAAKRDVCRVATVREPFCAAITSDGKTLAVGNLLPADKATDTNFIASCVTLIDAVSGTVIEHVRLSVGGNSIQGITISPDGRYAFATHITSGFNKIGTTVENGWLHSNDLAVVALDEKRLVAEVSLDRIQKGMASPWGIRFADGGRKLCIAHSGCDELSIIDYAALMDTVAAHAATGVTMEHEFSVLDSTRTVVAAGVPGPRAIATFGTMLFVAGYFSDTNPVVNVFDAAQQDAPMGAAIPLGVPQPRTGERQGEVNFFDARLCFQEWQSCHSCHPFCRTDGLNWILGGGTVVAPKNTKSMVYSWWTPPIRWTGHSGHAQTGIAAGLELELFRQATREIAVPLDTLLMRIRQVPSPWLVKGKLSDSAMRGKTIFYDRNRVDCIICHQPPLFTDCKFWNTGIPDPFDANTQWITPELTEIWRTAPYNHLGSMTLREVMEFPGHSNAARKLSPQEIDDLLAYVLSL